MNTYVWRRWRELDQLVRHMALANPNFNRRVSDAPPRAVHVYALVMRSPAWAALHPLAAACQRHGEDRIAQLALLKDPDHLLVLHGLAGILDTPKLQDLLALAVPDAPARLLKVLNNCGDDVLAPAFYGQLMQQLRIPAFGPVLLAPDASITMELLAHLQRASHFGPLTLKAFGEGKLNFRNADMLQAVIDAVVDVHGNGVLPVFEDALARWNRETAHEHADRLLNRLPAAPPPWSGNNTLRPVPSPAQLKTLGRRFSNCLAEYRLHMILGTQAFYVWTGPGTLAILSISRQANSQWALHEMKAQHNEPVPPDQASEIRHQLAAAGISPKLSIAKTLEAFTLAHLHHFRYAPD